MLPPTGPWFLLIAETLNMVAVESLACGTPVISFAVGGLPEVVIPGRSGILAGLPSASSLAEALNEALQLSPTTLLTED